MFEDLDAEHARPPGEAPDPVEIDARDLLREFFERNRQHVYFSRQLEVQHEDRYFHWITNRAIRELEAEGVIRSERRNLVSGGTIKLLWNRRFRYYRREAARLVDLVNEYSAPNNWSGARVTRRGFSTRRVRQHRVCNERAGDE